MATSRKPISLPDLSSPLPAGATWEWRARAGAWVRIYHRDVFTPNATHRRDYGPLHRFDHHSPAPDDPAVCPEGRSVTYIADGLRAAAAEVFGDVETFLVCPQWRVAWVKPAGRVVVQDITGAGAMQLGVRPAVGSTPRDLMPYDYTQGLARRIWEDHPEVAGMLYRGSHEDGRCMALWERATELEVVSEDGAECDYQLVRRDIFEEVLIEYLPTGNALDEIASRDCKYCQDAEAHTRAA